MNAAPSKEDRVSAKDRYDENYFYPYSEATTKTDSLWQVLRAGNQQGAKYV